MLRKLVTYATNQTQCATRNSLYKNNCRSRPTLYRRGVITVGVYRRDVIPEGVSLPAGQIAH